MLTPQVVSSADHKAAVRLATGRHGCNGLEDRPSWTTHERHFKALTLRPSSKGLRRSFKDILESFLLLQVKRFPVKQFPRKLGRDPPA